MPWARRSAKIRSSSPASSIRMDMGNSYELQSSFLHVQLNDVLIVQHVIALDALAVKDAGAPDAGGLEVLRKIAMHLGRQFDQRAARRARERRRHVRRLARLLGIDADHV